MAIVTGVNESGTEVLYDIPDSELSKHEMKSAQLTDDVIDRLFPGKGQPSKDDAHGVIPAAPSAGSDVQGYSTCMYWIQNGDTLYYWYDAC